MNKLSAVKEFDRFGYKLLASIVICLLLSLPVSAAGPDGDSGKPGGPGSRLKVGLALGGGGTRGAAHVTVLKVLEEEGIPIDLIAGTSIGSIVGGMYCAGLTPEQIKEKFMDKSVMKTFMTVPIWFRLLIGPFLLIPRALGFNSYDGLYKGGKFRKFLNNSVPEDQRLVESLHIPFAAVAIDLVDGKAYSIRKGNFGLAIQASSAVPALRKPVPMGNHLFIDGFLGGNLPVVQAREMGADIVIAVNVDERIEKVPLSTFRKMGSVSRRAINMKLAAIDAPLARVADVVIHPDVDGIDLISNKLSDAKKAFRNGETAARQAVPEIKRLLKAKGIATVSSR